MEEKKEGKIQHLDSKKPLQNSDEQGTSQNLMRNLSEELMLLIKEVNKEKVTPATVNASCNAAQEIHKILKLNFEMKKSGF